MSEPTLPQSLVEDVARILAGHIGKDRAIRRATIRQMLFSISPNYRTVNDKQIRAVIGILMDEGELICSLGSDSDGYYKAGSHEEFEEFKSFYLSYPLTMFERVKRMDANARQQWGEGIQPGLL